MTKTNMFFARYCLLFVFSLFVTPSALAVVTWDGSEGIGQNIFTANPTGSTACTSCHQESSPSFSPSLATHAQTSAYQNNATHVTNDDDPLSRILGEGANSMPFGEAQLSSAQQTLMTQWVSDGTLENAVPGISNLASSNVSYTTATLSADLYENGANATMSFEYSTSSSLSSASTHNPTTNTGTGTGGGTSADATITGPLTGLRCATTYYYRAVATNSVGTTNSHTSGYPSFTTLSCPSIPSQSIGGATENASYSETITATNPGGFSLTWDLVGEPSGMSIDSSGDISWDLTNDDNPISSDSFNVQITYDRGDGVNAAASRGFTVNVTTINDSPTISSTAPTSATEDTLYTYTPTDGDPDDTNNGTDLSWSLSNQPTGMSVDATTGVVTWTPTNGVTTSGVVTLTVEDGGEDGAVAGTENFTISVTAQNDPPSITSTAGTTATEDVEYTYTASVSDVDDSNNGTDLDWSLSNQPTGMVVSATGVVTWTPADGVTTSGTVTLTVEDGGEDGAAADTENFTISVTAVNDSPVITSTASTSATEDTEYSYTPTVSDPDDSNNGSDLVWGLSNEPSGMLVSSTGVVTWTPANGVTTSGTVTLTVTDGGEDSAVAGTENFTITVTAQNDPPSITSTAGTAATEDVEYTYTASVSDVDDDNNGTDLEWSLSNFPTGMDVDDFGVVTWTPANGVLSSGVVTLSVQDGLEDGAVPATEDFTISVTAVNDSPVITSTAPTSATEDTLYTYTPTDGDPDDSNNGTDLSWDISNQPTGMSVDETTGVVTWTPTNGVTTSGEVTLTVEDGGEDGAVPDTESFTITVTAQNDPPSITSTADTTATEDIQYTYTASVSDVDDSNNGTDLEWSLSNFPTGMEVDDFGVVTWTPANGVTTSGTVTLTVEDGGEDGATADTENFTISVTAVNDSPTITSTAPTSAIEDTLYTYTPTDGDPDDSNNGTDLSWSLSNQPTGMSVDATTGVVTWTPANGVTTSGTVTLTVEDGGEDGSVPGTENFTISVTVQNDPPSITSTAGTTATEDIEYTYTASVSDVDDSNNGTDLQWSLSNQPTGMVVSNTGEVTWTPANGVTTSGTVTLTVEDGGENGAAADTENFTISVTAVNDPPSITSSASTSVVEGNTYTYTATVLDVDDDNNGTDLEWNLSNQPSGMLVSSTGVVTWAPSNGVTTSGQVTLTVEDGREDGAAVASQQFEVIVTAFNTGPNITSTAGTTATEDQEYQYDVQVTDADDDNNGTDITFELSNQPTGMTITNAGLISWTPTNGVLTSGTVTLTVADGGEDGAAPATENFTITVTAVNDSPVISSTASTSATEDTLYTYTPTVSDPDDTNNGTDMSWSISNQPTGMAVDTSTGVVTWTPTNGVSTSGEVTLTVEDGGEDGAVAGTENFTISVTAVNDSPTITSTAPTSATEDTLYTYTPTVSDPDDTNNGTDMSWNISNQPTGMVVDTSTGVVTWTPDNGVTSSGTVTLTVQDGGEDGATSSSENFTITVTAVNDSPVISSTAPTSATEDTLYTYTPTVSDPDDTNNGTDMSWSISNQPTGMELDTSTGVVTWTPENGVTSSGEVTLSVEDGGEDGAVAGTENFTISVTAVNDSPVISSTAPTSATEDTLYTYTPTVSDPDDTNNGTDMSWNISNQPTGMAVDTSTGVVTWTPENGVASSGTVTLTVQDGGEDGATSSSENFTITVNAVNDSPVISSTAPTNATEDTLYTYTPTVSDPDDSNNGTDMSWSISNQPTGMEVDTNTGVVTWTPENGVTSSGEVTLSVEDGGEDSAVAGTENFTITVTAVNDGPTISSSASTSVVEGNLYTYTPTVNDPDDTNNGTDLTWGLSNPPTGMDINTGTGVITWTPENGVTSSGEVTLTVEDGGEDGAVGDSQTFEVTVVAFNTGPSITSTAGTTAIEDQEYQYQVDVSDADDSNNGTDIAFDLSNFPDGMIVSNTGLITWTPGNGISTSGEVSLTVSDGGEDGAESATESFTITVTAVNDGPVINSSAPDSATEDTLYIYTAEVSDVDDDNNGIDLTWELSNAPEGMVVDDFGEVSWTPTEGVLTSGEVTLSVQDGLENDAQPGSETFTITVTAVNDAPVIDSSPSTSALEDNLYSYQVEVVDVDDPNPATDLEFTLITAPADMSINDLGLVTWTPPEGATSEAVSIRVSDGGEDDAEPAIQDFTISIGIFNTGPTIDSTAPTTATEDIQYQYQLDITDPDDDNNGSDLAYNLVNAPEGMDVNATGLITWTPTEGVSESGTVTVEVTDGGEDSAQMATEDFSITVTAVNDAPVIISEAPTAVIEINLYSYQVNIDDPDDELSELSFELSGAPDGMTVDNSGLILWIPPEGTRTSGEVTLSVADGGEDSAQTATQVFTVEVTEFNTPPVITSIGATTATEDVEYSYQLVVDDIDDPNDGSGALRFWLFNAPEGMAVSDTGLLTWTPREGVTSSGHFSVYVADAGEDGAVAGQENMVIAVARVNDAPSITSTPTTSVNEGDLFTYQMELSDPDDDNNGVDFSFALSNAPDGMNISRVGLLSWQTGADSPVSSDIIITVRDGGEDGVEALNQRFTLTVVFDIDADGVVNAQDNCPETANADQADNDSDGLGDVCDSDDDNDGMSDEFEIIAELDPFDDGDADLDSDGDGTSNIDEFDAGSNPVADDIPPSLFVPLNIRVNSTGFETYVDIGQATATDSLNGPLVATSSRSSGLFRTGRHIITWTATDSLGNSASAEQIVDVIPQIHISRAMSAEEGQQVAVQVSLSGEPVRYPVTVSYEVSGDAAFGSDHDLSNGSIELTSMTGEISFGLIDDDITEGNESLNITLSSPRNAVLGQSEHTLTIVEANIAPKVELSVLQGDIPGLIVARDEGFVRVSSEVEDPNLNEAFSYDWSESDNVLSSVVGLSSDSFVFDPSELAFGIYKVKVRVTDNSNESASNELLIRVEELASIDEDADGIADDIDQTDAPFVLQTQPQGEALETEPGLSLQLGETATYDGADGGLIDLQSLQEHGDEGQPTDASTDFSFTGGLYDFVIRGLSQIGQSVSVVIPQLEPIPENAIYRKFTAETGWRDFTVDDNNRLASTFSFDETCPAPGSRAYQTGLNAGANCVELTIEDGGPNDADGETNGVIRDPGGVGYSPNATPSAGHAGTSDDTDLAETEEGQALEGKSGGAALNIFALWILMMLLIIQRRKMT